MKGFNILLTDKRFKSFIDNQQSSGMCDFKFLDYDTLEDGGKKYDPLDEKHRDGDEASCNFKYTHSAIRLDCNTFVEAVSNERFTKNDCWVNSIKYFYGDTLLSDSRKREVMTRQKLL